MKPTQPKNIRFEFFSAIPEIIAAYVMVFGLPALSASEEKREPPLPATPKILYTSQPQPMLSLQICEKPKNEYDAK